MLLPIIALANLPPAWSLALTLPEPEPGEPGLLDPYPKQNRCGRLSLGTVLIGGLSWFLSLLREEIAGRATSAYTSEI